MVKARPIVFLFVSFCSFFQVAVAQQNEPPPEICARRSLNGAIFQGQGHVEVDDTSLPQGIKDQVTTAMGLWNSGCDNGNFPHIPELNRQPPPAGVNEKKLIFDYRPDEAPPGQNGQFNPAKFVPQGEGGVITVYGKCPPPPGPSQPAPSILGCPGDGNLDWDTKKARAMLQHEIGHGLGLGHDQCPSSIMEEANLDKRSKVQPEHCQLADSLACMPSPGTMCPQVGDSAPFRVVVSGLDNGEQVEAIVTFTVPNVGSSSHTDGRVGNGEILFPRAVIGGDYSVSAFTPSNSIIECASASGSVSGVSPITANVSCSCRNGDCDSKEVIFFGSLDESTVASFFLAVLRASPPGVSLQTPAVQDGLIVFQGQQVNDTFQGVVENGWTYSVSVDDRAPGDLECHPNVVEGVVVASADPTARIDCSLGINSQDFCQVIPEYCFVDDPDCLQDFVVDPIEVAGTFDVQNIPDPGCDPDVLASCRTSPHDRAMRRNRLTCSSILDGGGETNRVDEGSMEEAAMGQLEALPSAATSTTVEIGPLVYLRSLYTTPISSANGDVLVWGVARDDGGSISDIQILLDGVEVALRDFSSGNLDSWTCDELPADSCDAYSSFWGWLDVSSLPDGAHQLLVTATSGVTELLGLDEASIQIGGSSCTDETIPPAVEVTWPTSGAQTSPGPLGHLSLAATASDDSGIAWVEFEIDGSSVGVDLQFPFEVSWHATPGSWQVRAIAADTCGNTATSPAIPFSVPSGPQIIVSNGANPPFEAGATLPWGTVDLGSGINSEARKSIKVLNDAGAHGTLVLQNSVPGEANVSVRGLIGSGFRWGGVLDSPHAPGEWDNFFIGLSTEDPGFYRSVVSIHHNDPTVQNPFDFLVEGSVGGNTASPEMTTRFGPEYFQHGDSKDYGCIALNTTAGDDRRSMRVANPAPPGGGVLHSSVSVQSVSGSAFYEDNILEPSIAPGDEDGFVVGLRRDAIGDFAAKLLFQHNVVGLANPFVVNVSAQVRQSCFPGQALRFVDFLEVKDSSGAAVDETFPLEIGSHQQVPGMVAPASFTITNISGEAVTVEQILLQRRIGSEAISWQSSPVLPLTLASGARQELRLNLSRDEIGFYLYEVTLISAEAGTSTFEIWGAVYEPLPSDFDVALALSGSVVPPGSGHTFNITLVGSSAVRHLLIRNNGASPLELASTTGLVSGPCFLQGTQPAAVIPPGGETDFWITFGGCTTAGLKTGALSIETTNPVDEPYLITLHGWMKDPIPGIGVKVGSSGSLMRGSTVPVGTVIEGNQRWRKVRIHNDGSGDLEITNPANLVSGTCFQQHDEPQSVVRSGEETTFWVNFGCTTPGSYSGGVNIESNSPFENPFDLELTGTVVGAPDIRVTHDGVTLPSGRALSFAPSTPGQQQSERLVIWNEGLSSLWIDDPAFSVSGGCFSATSGAGTASEENSGDTIPPGGSLEVDLLFECDLAGVRKGMLSLESNDPDEIPFQLFLSGLVEQCSASQAGTLVTTSSGTFCCAATSIDNDTVHLLEDASSGACSILSSCPTFQNHNRKMGESLGSDWVTRVTQGQFASCCNPSQRCNRGACYLPGTVLPRLHSFDEICADTGLGPAVYRCDEDNLGRVLLDLDTANAWSCDRELVGGETLYTFSAGPGLGGQ
ncbi:MAG: choice-of-anchor D domain-containing protein [Deltaproteobacteria bacterium]|nr:choice-of-anchor D domain-containing protein [Deltaproteobacteria bacterium]